MIKSLEAKEQELVSVRASLNVSGYYFFFIGNIGVQGAFLIKECW